jgi:15-cis-phytoene synthase
MDDLLKINEYKNENYTKSNFLYSTLLLPKEKRKAINTIYSYCRIMDDIADDETAGIEEKQNKLNGWKEELIKAFNSGTDNVLLNELKDVVEKYDIPKPLFFEIIKGMELDLLKNRYLTFEELYQYCYYVASTVGLMTIGIFGYKNKMTIDYAINLGIALQLTNILRDIKKDLKSERIYLPLEDLIKFNYSEDELKKNAYNENFKALIKYEIERTKQFYEKADSFLSKEDRGSMFSAVIMGKTYFGILKKIEDANYNVFSKEIKLSKFRKIIKAVFIYIKYKLMY